MSRYEQLMILFSEEVTYALRLSIKINVMDPPHLVWVEFLYKRSLIPITAKNHLQDMLVKSKCHLFHLSIINTPRSNAGRSFRPDIVALYGRF